MSLNPLDSFDELQRIKALHGLEILDTAEEQEYDELVQLASEICATPISLVSLVDRDRQWFKAAVGLEAKQTPRDLSFCSHAIQKPDLFIIEDATADHRFRDNELVTGPLNIRFYAGIPLQAPSGHAIGALCVIDTVPRQLSDSQKSALTILGRQVKARLELRQKQKQLEHAMKCNEELMADLRDRNNLFSAFMNNGPFLSYIKDYQGRYVYYNDQLRHQFHVKADDWIGLTDHDIWPAEVADLFRARDLEVLTGGLPVELNEFSPNEEKELVHWKSYKFPFVREDGQRMLAGMSLDVTQETRRKEELDRTMEEKLALAASLERSTTLMTTFINNNPNVCYFKDQEGRYLSYNSKFAELFGIELDTWVGRTDREVLPPDLADHFRAQDLAVLAQDEVMHSTEHVPVPGAQRLWFKGFKFRIKTPDGAIILAGVAIDVTREMEKEQQLSEANRKLELLATTDLLTGLSNRRVFEERIGLEFQQAMRKQRWLGLMLLDIDDFKKRNDSYGHAAGDEALRVLGGVLLNSIRIGDLAARIGGEEFAVLLPETNAEQAALLAGRIQTILGSADHGPVPLTVSIGIASVSGSSPKGIESWKRLLSCADAAMYDAKKAGKDRVVIYESYGISMHELIGS